MVGSRFTFATNQSQQFSRSIAIGVSGVGVLTLLGWWLGVSSRHSTLASIAVQPYVAITFVLAAISLYLLLGDTSTFGQRVLGRVAAVVVCLLAAISLLEQPSSAWCFEQLLFDLEWNSGSTRPTRMSLATSLTLLLLGVALLMLDAQRVAKAAELFAVVALFICLLGLTSDAFTLAVTRDRPVGRPLRIPVVLTLLVLAVGILHARPDRGWMRVITSQRQGGVLARRLLPFAVLGPFLLGMLWLLSSEADIGETLGLRFYVLANMVAVAIFVVWYAAVLNRLDAKRSQTESELEQERTLLRTLLDALPDAIWTKDAATKFVVSNRAHDAMVRAATEADVAGKTGYDFHPPELAKLYEEDDMRVLRDGETVLNKEEMVRDGAGRDQCTLVIKAPLRDRIGNIIGLVGISRNIQDRKEAEQSLRDSESLFHSAFDHTHVAMVILGLDHRFLQVNAAFAKYLGYTPTELLKLSMPDITHPDDLAESFARREVLLAGNHHFVQEKRYIHKSGRVLWACTNVSLVRDAAHQPMLYVGQVQDITDRRQLEEQFRQSQKLEAVGRLAGGVAHDFNNLLTVINGFSEVLLSSLERKDANRELVEAIHDAGNRAAALTSQLLAFSRNAIVEPKVLDLNQVLLHAEGLLRRLIGADVILSTALAPDLCRVKADKTQVEQIVMNLAVNARDAMPKGGRLTFETRGVRVDEDDAGTYPDLKAGDYIQLAVSDTGCGMTEEVKTKVFEPFFTTKAVGKGTGLGLSMVYGVVKAHGGHVDVYSEVGVGTTFKILLPATRDADSPKIVEERVATDGTETVLLAEDEASVRKCARQALESKGYTVLEAASGAEAIRIATEYKGQIHLLVTDLVMPGMGGRELAETLRARQPALKVLFVSGYTDDAVVRHGIVKAADAFLQKPFTPLSLARKVRAVLDDVR